MRISITGESYISEDVRIHGKIPRAPERSCKNCSRKPDCKILQFSLNTLSAVDFVPMTEGSLMDYADMAFPMPCRGVDWMSGAKVTEINDPLVQRLGLGDVGEPVIERHIEENENR